jgi:ABC-2 type transport system permease protein
MPDPFFAAPGFPWLFGQEIRLLWRGSILLRSRRFVVVPVIVVLIVFQAVGLLLAAEIVQHRLPLAEMILVANLNLFFFGFLMLSRGMSSAVDALYARGDVDFLLASPIAPGRVLAVRMIGVAGSVSSPWLLLGGVLANGLALHGQVWALAIYPVLLALGLIASAAAFALVVVLVGRVGPGTARRMAHGMALFMGVFIFALGQAPRYLSPSTMQAIWTLMMPGKNISGAQWIPGRAMLGQAGPLLLFIILSLAAFGLVWLTLDKKFATGAISAAAYRPGGQQSRQTGTFRNGPGAALFVQNLRVLARFPGVVTQTVYRSLTLVPVLMILGGRVRIGAGPEVVAPLLVFLAGQLALFFISVMVGGDQSPELTASAPVAPAALRRARLLAASYATLLILALPVIGVVWREAQVVPVLLAGMAGVLLSNALMGLKLPIPLIRATFGKAQTGTVLGLICGVAVSSVWSLAVWLAVTPHPLAWLLKG